MRWRTSPSLWAAISRPSGRHGGCEVLSDLFVKNDRGEMVPYSSFLQLKLKQGLKEIDR